MLKFGATNNRQHMNTYSNSRAENTSTPLKLLGGTAMSIMSYLIINLKRDILVTSKFNKIKYRLIYCIAHIFVACRCKVYYLILTNLWFNDFNFSSVYLRSTFPDF